MGREEHPPPPRALECCVLSPSGGGCSAPAEATEDVSDLLSHHAMVVLQLFLFFFFFKCSPLRVICRNDFCFPRCSSYVDPIWLVRASTAFLVTPEIPRLAGRHAVVVLPVFLSAFFFSKCSPRVHSLTPLPMTPEGPLCSFICPRVICREKSTEFDV